MLKKYANKFPKFFYHIYAKNLWLFHHKNCKTDRITIRLLDLAVKRRHHTERGGRIH